MKIFKSTLLLLVLLTGCSAFQNKSDIRSFDRSYLKDKYVGKTGWAKTDLGGIKQGEKLTINDIDFGIRTIVRIKNEKTDYYFIIYSNKDLKDGSKKTNVNYQINTIENEIINRIKFLN